MSGPRLPTEHSLKEPSWRTARSEADTVSRRLRQAIASMEALSRELQALREWSDTVARLELAHTLTEGPDGGALNAFVTRASNEDADAGSRRTAELLLERLTSALGLQAVGERGEYLMLLPDDLGEFEIRGPLAPPSPEGQRGLYRVMRPGWWLGDHIVVRPLLEAVTEGSLPSTPGVSPSDPAPPP